MVDVLRPYIPETDPQKVVAKLDKTSGAKIINNRQILECLVDAHNTITPLAGPQEYPEELALTAEGRLSTYLGAEVASSYSKRVPGYPDALVAACLYPIPGSDPKDGYGLRFWLQANGQYGGIITQHTMEEERDKVSLGIKLTQKIKREALQGVREILVSYTHSTPVPA